MRGLILLALLLLAGCWVGAPFYAPSEAVSALPPGRYRAIAPDAGEPEKIVRVSRRRDGMTRLDTRGEKPAVVGFSPLGTKGGAFVGWNAPDGAEDSAEPVQVYWLFLARDGDFFVYAPFCQGEAAEVAAAAGAEVERDVKVSGCRFPDRASLEAAMLRLGPRSDEMLRLVRLR